MLTVLNLHWFTNVTQRNQANGTTRSAKSLTATAAAAATAPVAITVSWTGGDGLRAGGATTTGVGERAAGGGVGSGTEENEKHDVQACARTHRARVTSHLD